LSVKDACKFLYNQEVTAIMRDGADGLKERNEDVGMKNQIGSVGFTDTRKPASAGLMVGHNSGLTSENTDKTSGPIQVKDATRLELRDALISKSEEASQSGHLYEAVRQATYAIDLAPGKPDAYLLRASVRGALGFFKEAIDDCNKAIMLNADKPEGYILRATQLAALTRVEEMQKTKTDSEQFEHDTFDEIILIIAAGETPVKKTELPTIKGYDFASDPRAAAFQRYANSSQIFRQNKWTAEFGTVVPTIKNGRTVTKTIVQDRILHIKESTGNIISEFRFEGL
jgi:tetratricopeptide (TPR) repeat protein